MLNSYNFPLKKTNVKFRYSQCLFADKSVVSMQTMDDNIPLQGTKEITKKFLMGHLSDFIQQHPETSWGRHIFPSDRKFTVHIPHRNMLITHRIEADC